MSFKQPFQLLMKWVKSLAILKSTFIKIYRDKNIKKVIDFKKNDF